MSAVPIIRADVQRTFDLQTRTQAMENADAVRTSVMISAVVSEIRYQSSAHM